MTPTQTDTPLTGPPHHTGRSRRPTVNITMPERTARVVLGLAALIVGVVLLTSADAGLAVMLELLLLAAGLDLVVTGAIGHCPLYAKLGHVPRSLRGDRHE